MALRTPAFNDAKTYGFEWVRAALVETVLQEGVLNFGGGGLDFKVTAAAGGGMKVDVSNGAALVKGDSGVPATGLTQGLFFAINDAAILNAATLGAAHATLPRIDQIVLRIRDSSDLGTGADDAAIIVVAGAATSGATLDNRNGAAALPNDCIRLADILVPASSVAVTAGNVRDRRPWARGAFWRGIRTAGNLTVGTTAALLDSTNLTPRLETSGNPVRMTVTAGATHSSAGQSLAGAAWVDGVPPDGANSYPYFAYAPIANYYVPFTFVHPFAPAAGSHLIGPASASSAASGTVLASASSPLVVSVEEIVRPSYAQN